MSAGAVQRRRELPKMSHASASSRISALRFSRGDRPLFLRHLLADRAEIDYNRAECARCADCLNQSPWMLKTFFLSQCAAHRAACLAVLGAWVAMPAISRCRAYRGGGALTACRPAISVAGLDRLIKRSECGRREIYNPLSRAAADVVKTARSRNVRRKVARCKQAARFSGVCRSVDGQSRGSFTDAPSIQDAGRAPRRVSVFT